MIKKSKSKTNLALNLTRCHWRIHTINPRFPCSVWRQEGGSCMLWKFYYIQFQKKLLMRLQTYRTLIPFLLICIGKKYAISSETDRERTLFFSESLWLLCLGKMWDNLQAVRIKITFSVTENNDINVFSWAASLGRNICAGHSTSGHRI